MQINARDCCSDLGNVTIGGDSFLYVSNQCFDPFTAQQYVPQLTINNLTIDPSAPDGYGYTSRVTIFGIAGLQITHDIKIGPNDAVGWDDTGYGARLDIGVDEG